jgi:rare lipoprotein A
MRRRIAQGLTMALLVGLGAAQRPTSSRSAIQDAAGAQFLGAVAFPASLRIRLNSRPYQVGTASWYGEDFVGKPTASGEPYDMYALTAAHPKLPLGTLVRVTNLENRRSVIVRINDRGPIVSGRIIDVSYSAAQDLNFMRLGIQRVRLDVISAPAPTTTIAMLGELVLAR